ncbi:guanine nucleotide exchange factor MSS4 [Caerostris extrusa]|uniref:Guanine nucleotide exchange factor MSS4 n=1 Tax=Caerostris extrusa TaxID=172846 RepID=A0AAV4RUA8_CAEEX|nr:guanine nucleotide exchange factor MSS4 [Caerostris extrusa]
MLRYFSDINGITIALMADTAQNLVENLILPKDAEVKIVDEIARNADVNTEGKNVKQIKCQMCPSIILVPGIASLVAHEFKLPDLQKKEGKEKAPDNSVNKYWCVDNMYAFENVGFSKTVDGVKYLICADCEIGPIGWHDLNTKLSYVSVSKISYC